VICIDINDENAQVSLSVVNELLEGTHGNLICGVYTLDSSNSRLNFEGDVSFNSFSIFKFKISPNDFDGRIFSKISFC